LAIGDLPVRTRRLPAVARWGCVGGRGRPRSWRGGENSDLCRAGFQPRHKRTRLSPPTACAGLPAQLPPYGLDLRAHQVSSLLGGRSFNSDITMPLCLTTACAESPAQSPPCGVVARAIFRGPLVPGARCVRPGRICGTRFPRDTGTLITRH
jgi:hypothetical protein